jgi:hypothetical protein
MLATGCRPAPKATEMAEVSGKVLFRNQPLPGGRVTFVSKDGPAFSGGGNIDENGNYKVEAPVGDVKVSVDNQMLAPARQKGRVAPTKKPGLKRPGSEEAHAMKGRYVSIPEKYYSADESGLNYTVKKGPQTIEIKLE